MVEQLGKVEKLEKPPSKQEIGRVFIHTFIYNARLCLLSPIYVRSPICECDMHGHLIGKSLQPARKAKKLSVGPADVGKSSETQRYSLERIFCS